MGGAWERNSKNWDNCNSPTIKFFLITTTTKKENIHPHIKLYTNVYSGIIHNILEGETT